MKKLFITTMLSILLLNPALVVAADTDLPNPGITPDNPLYFFDGMFEKLTLLFTYSGEKKLELRLNYAKERLAEAKKMAEEGKEKEAEIAKNKYEEEMDNAIESAENESDVTGKENALNRIEEAMIRHQEVMTRVLEQVPDQAKESIQKVIDKNSQGLQNAESAITKVREEKENKHREENQTRNRDDD